VPAGTTLRFDQVPLEDFLACLMQHERDVRPGYLPPVRNLKEARLQTLWRPAGYRDDATLSIYLLQETDALTQKVETFLLLHGPSGAAAALADLAGRLKRSLASRGQHSLFRIDTRYGLVNGSALEPVDPSIKWDRPGCTVALYLTEDPASPSLALMEYVPAEHRRKFQELFLRYNQVQPSAPGLLESTFKRFVGGAKAVDPPRRLTYALLKGLAAFLAVEGVQNTTVSLIFKDLTADEGKRVLLDPKFGAFYPSGQDRFVASLGELA
jgi:hypothetical protein